MTANGSKRRPQALGEPGHPLGGRPQPDDAQVQALPVERSAQHQHVSLGLAQPENGLDVLDDARRRGGGGGGEHRRVVVQLIVDALLPARSSAASWLFMRAALAMVSQEQSW